MNSRWKKHTFFLIPKKNLVANKKCVNKKLSLFISAKQKKTQTQRLTIQNPFKLAKTGMVVPNSNLKQSNFEYVRTLPTKNIKKLIIIQKIQRLLLFHKIAKTKVASMNKKLIIYSPKNRAELKITIIIMMTTTTATMMVIFEAKKQDKKKIRNHFWYLNRKRRTQRHIFRAFFY